MLWACLGFSAIAGLTWLFASRPRSFIRLFVPRDEYRQAARTFLRDPDFCRTMRLMSLAQFAVGGLFGLVWLGISVAPSGMTPALPAAGGALGAFVAHLIGLRYFERFEINLVAIGFAICAMAGIFVFEGNYHGAWHARYGVAVSVAAALVISLMAGGFHHARYRQRRQR